MNRSAGRVGSKNSWILAGRIESGHAFSGSGRVGSQNLDPRATLHCISPRLLQCFPQRKVVLLKSPLLRDHGRATRCLAFAQKDGHCWSYRVVQEIRRTTPPRLHYGHSCEDSSLCEYSQLSKSRCRYSARRPTWYARCQARTDLLSLFLCNWNKYIIYGQQLSM